MKSRPFKIALRLSAGLLILYTGIYLYLSLRGRYEPSVLSSKGVWYEWAPSGFVEDFRWNKSWIIAFLPLYQLDRHLWHTGELAYVGIYPVNRASMEEIDRSLWPEEGKARAHQE